MAEDPLDLGEQFRYQYSHNTLECWKTVQLRRKSKGRPVDTGKIQLPKLRVGCRPISMKKQADLLPYIPPVFHVSYQQLEKPRNPALLYQTDFPYVFPAGHETNFGIAPWKHLTRE